VNALSAERMLSPSRVAVTVGAAAAVALAFASAFSSVAMRSSSAWIRAAASLAVACCVTPLDDGAFVAGVPFAARCASLAGSWAGVVCARAARPVATMPPEGESERDETR